MRSVRALPAPALPDQAQRHAEGRQIAVVHRVAAERPRLGAALGATRRSIGSRLHESTRLTSALRPGCASPSSRAVRRPSPHPLSFHRAIRVVDPCSGYPEHLLATGFPEERVPSQGPSQPAGESPARASRQRSPVVNSPASGETRAPKRGRAKLQAVAPSELCRVEKKSRKGLRGPSLGSSGEGSSPGPRFWSTPDHLRRRGDGMQRRLAGQLGPASCARGGVERRGACTGISHEAKSRAAQRQSERGIVPVDRRDNRTRRRKGSGLR